MNAENFESNHYYAQEYKDVDGDDHHGVESFTLVNDIGSRAIGYIQNRYSFWNTIPSCGSESMPSVGVKAKLVIHDLQVWPVKFEIDWYRTGDASMYNTYPGKRANLTGTLKFKVFEPFQWAPDYAYKIFKTSNHEVELDKTFPIDTLDCPNDTIRFTGIFKEDTLGTQLAYNWDFGNGERSTLAHPKVYYSHPGIYSVVLILSENSTGSIDTLSQQFVLTSCDSSIQRMVIINNIVYQKGENNFNLFPNPNNGVFTFQTDANIEGDVIIYDLLGQKIFQKHFLNSDSQNIDIRTKDKGLYFLKVIGQGIILFTTKFVIN